MSPERLRSQLEYYRDLGVKDLYRRPAPVVAATPAPEPAVAEAIPEMPIPDIVLPGLAPEGDTLERICADIGDCTRCRLHTGRNKIVFGVGDPNTKLV
ncbi:MAG TPA: hypothetical protein VNH18_01540, partial [Bryobacteraceae bacterium]|nr:hypothetical protein [Bryobacteraceae bacterium]